MQRDQSYMSNRIPSTEDGCPFSDDSVKTVGRFSVSPPLVPSCDIRRLTRLSQSDSNESPTRTCRSVMENLGQVVGSLLERNAHLEEENGRLHRELKIMRVKDINGSPLSHYSVSTDEGHDVSPRI